MGDYTFLRVEIGNDTVAGVIDKVPGVAAVDDLPVDDDGEQPSTVDSEDFDPESRASTAFETNEEGSGRKDQVVGLAREWGLLGLGISMVGLGAAIAGLWFYRRRKRSDEEPAEEWGTATDEPNGETPPPAAAEPTDGSIADSEAESRASETQSETVLADTDADEDGDESIDEEWVTRTTDTTEEESAPATGEATDEERTEHDSIDAAPLVGMAFLVILGALVKWAQGHAEDDA